MSSHCSITKSTLSRLLLAADRTNFRLFRATQWPIGCRLSCREQSDHAFPVPTGIFENDSVMASKPGRLIAPYRCGRRQLPLDGSATAPLVTGTHTRWLATSIITINFCRLASRTATVTIVPPAQCRNGKRAYLSRSFQKENVSDYLPGAGHSPLRRAIFPRFMRRPISLLPHSVRCSQNACSHHRFRRARFTLKRQGLDFKDLGVGSNRAVRTEPTWRRCREVTNGKFNSNIFTSNIENPEINAFELVPLF
jgi:hypothetical protein